MIKVLFNVKLLSLLLIIVSTDTLKKEKNTTINNFDEELNCYVKEIIDADKLIVSTIQNTRKVEEDRYKLAD
ncbi:hypothetical protein [Flammeovirga kamogawensis]|uniref:Uncharacterized protein n=1 Tax=Flammeovirga kamogawensis TaxID=373891 RepID=A0ABX8H2S8_9BACT|nr:hypothetical protein [Flammeovirga kamogawensis]MBB6460316.1 hypothetical protein [Flammeovirga kamogawensis]QWG10125.1 hypothetical protein KM029_20805 [Flammeovirga kamogawensis]TRX65634.1 hypothetical protein EO216_24240 [Flammeovirga kamogawensis]